MILILIATMLADWLYFYLSVHTSPILTFFQEFEDLCVDRKWQKTDDIEPKITVDFNFEGMAFIVLDYIFTKSVQSRLCFTLRKPAHATYSDFIWL